MKRQIQELVQRYGQRVILHCAGRIAETRAFLQPVTERNEQEPDQMTPLGTVDGRLWLYLGTEKVAAGDKVFWNGMDLQVRSSRPYCIGDDLLYWWGALEQAKEAVS